MVILVLLRVVYCLGEPLHTVAVRVRQAHAPPRSPEAAVVGAAAAAGGGLRQQQHLGRGVMSTVAPAKLRVACES